MEIEHVCSLGTKCQTASLMKRIGLRLEAYPFDWISADYSNILHCISTQFNIFLDKSYYITTPGNTCGNNQICGHTIYNAGMFVHHNPLLNKDHYDYFVRCVEWFKYLIKTIKPKLFIIFIIGDADDTIKQTITEFNNSFTEYTNNYILLVIINLPNQQINYYNWTIVDNIHFLELHTLSTSTGREFTNNNDNIFLDNIIQKKYTFNQKYLNSINNANLKNSTINKNSTNNNSNLNNKKNNSSFRFKLFKTRANQ
jgi:hypothetical protein